MNVLSWAVVIYIISCGVNPSYKIAWIVLILAFPVAGLTIYLLFGGNKISATSTGRCSRSRPSPCSSCGRTKRPYGSWPAAKRPRSTTRAICSRPPGYPIYDDADAEYFPSGESCYAAMLEETKRRSAIFSLKFFIIATGKMWDPMLELLRQKAAAGVDVRVVYDDFGCITPLPMGLREKAARDGHPRPRVQPLYPDPFRPPQ